VATDADVFAVVAIDAAAWKLGASIFEAGMFASGTTARHSELEQVRWGFTQVGKVLLT
jgi:hypothetical protein